MPCYISVQKGYAVPTGRERQGGEGGRTTSQRRNTSREGECSNRSKGPHTPQGVSFFIIGQLLVGLALQCPIGPTGGLFAGDLQCCNTVWSYMMRQWGESVVSRVVTVVFLKIAKCPNVLYSLDTDAMVKNGLQESRLARKIKPTAALIVKCEGIMLLKGRQVSRLSSPN